MNSTSSLSRPPVRPDQDSAPFWAAAAEGRLIGQHCGACGIWRWPPREHCAACHAAAPQWDTLSGAGTVEGAVVVHRAFDPAFHDALPITIVHVAMDGTGDQMVLIGTLAPSIPAADAVGARVALEFRDLGGGPIPFFTLSGA